MSDETKSINPGERTKAYRLRGKVKRQEEVSPEDAAWLHDYEQRQSVGASASRRVSYTEEEHAAVGTGSAAEVAAAAALAREEGRRIDYLAQTGIKAMETAFGMLKTVADVMIGRMQQMEDVHLGMLEAVRTHYIARTEAEADAIRKEAEQAEGGMEQAALSILLERLLPGSTRQLPTTTPKHRNGRGSKSAK